MRQINALEVDYYHAQSLKSIHDMPIGDAFKGPAYGEYEKSKGIGMILGIIASVITMGAALPMLAATATLATQIAGGVMMAGGVLTGVGAITGNAKLMKIGGVLSLAGGIGNWALNATGTAGALGTGSEALGKFATSVGDTFGMEFAATASAKASTAAEMAAETGTQSALAGTEQMGAIPLAGVEPVVGVPLDAAVEQMGAIPLPNATPVVGTPLDPAAIPLATAPPAAGATSYTSEGAMVRAAATTEAGTFAPPAATTAPAKMGLIEKYTGLPPTEAKLAIDVVKGFFSPAEQENVAAASKLAGAQATLLGTRNEQEAWQNANRKTQVVMISANDPNMATLMADAAKKGFPVGIIPVVGRPQATPGQTPLTNAQTITANNPAPVFNSTVPVTK